MEKVLKTGNNVLDKDQLKDSLIKLASNTTILKNSSIQTYPISRLKENSEYIYWVYILLNQHIKMNIPIHPAGEWILDNYYLIEKSAKIVSKELCKSKYKKLPGIYGSGFARIFVIANEIVSNTEGKIKIEDLHEYLEAYQTKQKLEMDEIWNLGLFLQICIIEKIREICEKIFVSQTQKYKALNIVERIIENRKQPKIKTKIEGKFPFIEFLSFQLKKYGKVSIPYLNALEDQIKRSGMTIEDIINREHFDIAVKTLAMKNCILSIKAISRMDIANVFKKVNIVEKILCQDPAKVYDKMDNSTKSYYRSKIQELSKSAKLSEVYIAEQAINLCKEKAQNAELKHNPRNTHVGYYLIDKGLEELLFKLLNKKVHITSNQRKAKNYIIAIYLFSILFTFLLTKFLKGYAVLLYIPIQNAVTQIIQYFLSKMRKTRLIPKMNFEDGIPDKCKTMCIIPTILKDEKDVEEIVKKMEVYYLANKSNNLFFTLLGDCTSSNKQHEKIDSKIIKKGVELTDELNKKYGRIFYFVYRKREWSHGEKCFMGWERKRGLINQYNEFLKTGKDNFLKNTSKDLPDIKYVITLDSDTNLTLNSAFELVGAMSHILNIPEIDPIKNIVINGHAIIQPRIGLNIRDGRKTIFSRLWAGNGGTDLYTNAISDVYQDNFDEGIYTGKGIYDLDAFYKVMRDSIPENTILSHDLLEGSYLRCGLASDILLMDGYPSKYLTYKARKHRWIRGDMQTIKWLRSKLNFLSKYKIIDNIVRNMNELCIFISLLVFTIKMHSYLFIPLIIYAIPTIIKLIDNLINQKNGVIKHRLFVSTFSKWTHAIYKFLAEIAIIPDISFLEISAIFKALYRMYISHNMMLEWTTSAETERQSKDDYLSYKKNMILEDITALILLIYAIVNFYRFNMVNKVILIIIAILWKSSTVLMWALSKQINRVNTIPEKDKKYLIDISKRTWRYFKDNTVNYLPADNYQEDRSEKVALRTSPTNIGLFMLSTIASYDLKIESLQHTIDLLKNTLDSVNQMQKWNGHLYNWYDIQTLEPLHPYEVSSVDSGNFVGYLYTVKQFLLEHKKSDNRVKEMINLIETIIQDTDFKPLYNYENGLFSIGFNVEQNKLSDSYYDLLASEARQTSLIAIAKKDIPPKHWGNLGRTLTSIWKHIGLVSWGGTAFEYLMPNINIPTYPSTLIDESCKLLIAGDKVYAQKMNLPWGISESAFSLKDFNGNFQYKTFGIPWLGLKRGLADDTVISPYSSALALSITPKDSISNLRELDKEGLTGKYGFYDAIDYKPKKKIVKTYMAHHQGMIIASIDNVLNNNIFQKRFMKNPEIQGIEILLQENMPEDVIITKEKKDKAKKIKYAGYEKSEPRNHGVNLISSNGLSNMVSQTGDGFTKLDENLMFKEVNVYIKNVNTNKIYDINSSLKNREQIAQVNFTPSYSKIILEDGNLKSTIKTSLIPNSRIEIRKIKIKNKGINSVLIELSTYTEPILANLRDHNAHPSFSKMFLKYESKNNILVVTRKSRRENEIEPYLASTLYGQDIGVEFEIDKEKFMARGDGEIPTAVQNSKPLSKQIETVINPILAFKTTLNIEPGKSKEVYLISSANFEKEKTIANIEQYTNIERLNRAFELTKEQTEAEIRYMGLTEQDVSTYQQMIKYLLDSKQEAYQRSNQKELIHAELNLSNENLWKYGISGDYPLLVLKLKEQNDYETINDIIKAYKYFRSKGLVVELIIISNKLVRLDEFSEKIRDFLNKRGGIFVLQDLRYDEIINIEARANLELNAQDGSLRIQMAEIDKNINSGCKYSDTELEIIENNKVTLNEIPKKDSKTKNIINTKYKELKYENGYGSFNNDNTEYWVKQSKNNKIPVAWSNIMANEVYGTVLTESMGGFTWYINSQTNKITTFTNDAFKDEQSEKISIKGYEQQGDEEYYSGFGMGYSQFAKEVKGIKQELTVFVPTDDSAKISILQIENLCDNEVNLDIQYNVSLQMAENKDNSIIVESFKKSLNMILARNLMNNKYITYITSNETIDQNKEVHINLQPKSKKEIVFILGNQKTEMECVESGTKHITSYIKEFETTKKYWSEKVSGVIAKTPLESFNIMQNGRLAYQTIVSRMIGRTGFYQSSGGYGFRDQLQDALGMKWLDSNILKEQILLHARRQFLEGDVEHWWHEDTNLGIRARYSDDLLWLVYAVVEYIDFTGDYSILNCEVNYIETEVLKNIEADRVDYYKPSSKQGSIFEHCLKALNIAIQLGNHNLPLMKHGDWNDGMNRIGDKGYGESVWLGFFLYDILVRFVDIIEYREKNNPTKYINKDFEVGINEHGDKNLQPTEIQEYEKVYYTETKEKFKNISTKLKVALNTTAWDGKWYLRAFDDNGSKIGSISNEECKIDSIPQSFSVISNAGDNDKKYIAMSSLENYLIDNENNLVKLLTPALEKTNLGYISSYAKGMRENGGQYTHECCC